MLNHIFRLALAVPLLAGGLGLALPAAAQTPLPIDSTARYCAYVPQATIPVRLYEFRSSNEATLVIKEVLAAIGLKVKFDIKAANVPNAAAVIWDNKRMILYSETFMNDLDNNIGNRWAAISILAHEIGHHLNGHTLQNELRPEDELEADEFAGFVIGRMGGSLKEAQAAMNAYADEYDTPTHPGKRTRLAAIAAGWKNAQEQKAKRGADNNEPVPTNPEGRELAQSAQIALDKAPATKAAPAEVAEARTATAAEAAPPPSAPIKVPERAAEKAAPAAEERAGQVPRPEGGGVPKPAPGTDKAPVADKADEKKAEAWKLRRVIVPSRPSEEFYLSTRGSLLQSTAQGMVVKGRLQRAPEGSAYVFMLVQEGKAFWFIAKDGVVYNTQGKAIGYLKKDG